jgi:NitT/TauT family transport system substrate-binding protein
MSRKALFLIAATVSASILALAFIIFMAGTQEKNMPGKPRAAEIRLAVYRGDTSLVVYAARELGYFEEQGLRVRFIEYEAERLAADAMLSGAADIATAAEAVLVSNSFKNPDLRVFASISECRTNGLIARRDRGIETGKDLAGKRIGLTRMSSGEYDFGVFLAFNGLSFENVEIIDMNPSEIVETLAEGNIDAGFTWEPNIYKGEKILGENALIIKEKVPEMYFLLLARNAWLKNNQGIAAEFVKALLKAEKYIREHPDSAAGLMAAEFGLDVDYLEASWSNHYFVVGLPQSLILSMEDQARWAVDNGLFEAEKIPNYLDFIDTGILDAVDSGKVGILR